MIAAANTATDTAVWASATPAGIFNPLSRLHHMFTAKQKIYCIAIHDFVIVSSFLHEHGNFKNNALTVVTWFRNQKLYM